MVHKIPQWQTLISRFRNNNKLRDKIHLLSQPQCNSNTVKDLVHSVEHILFDTIWVREQKDAISAGCLQLFCTAIAKLSLIQQPFKQLQVPTKYVFDSKYLSMLEIPLKWFDNGSPCNRKPEKWIERFQSFLEQGLRFMNIHQVTLISRRCGINLKIENWQ